MRGLHSDWKLCILCELLLREVFPIVYGVGYPKLSRL